MISGACAVSAGLALAVFSAALLAQTAIPAKAGLVDYTQGKVYLGDHAVEATSTHFFDMQENDVMRTESGRAEVLLGACTVMWIGGDSSFRMLSNSLTDVRLELLTGSAVVAVGAASKDSKLALVVQPVTVLPGRKGLYRFDMKPARLKVIGGTAMVESPGQVLPVGAGRMAALNGTVDIQKADKRSTDELEEWSKNRAAILAKASNLNRQELQRASGVDAAAAEAAAAPPPTRDQTPPYRLSAGVYQGPSPIPDIPRRTVSVGYGICGGGW